jgi:hypothetical protein
VQQPHSGDEKKDNEPLDWPRDEEAVDKDGFCL